MIISEKDGAYCVSFESCAFANLGYRWKYELGPGEIVLVTPDGMKQVSPPRREMKICAFLWVYYGYPSSTYEGMNVEIMRNRNGALMARNDNAQVDIVAGVPDSGVAHAIGYSNESRIPFGRPFIKYTPTWSRSFMPQTQEMRNLVARMKLMPIMDHIEGKRLLFIDDSIVRGTQMRETAELLYNCKAKEVHVRSACPPLVYGCKFLNFSRSRSELDLAARQAIKKLEGNDSVALDEYSNPTTERYHCMVDCIGKRLNFTSLKYQAMPDMLDAICLPHENICTYCWNGRMIWDRGDRFLVPLFGTRNLSPCPNTEWRNIMKQDMIVILDLGSNDNTTIARAIRTLGVYSEIHPHDISAAKLSSLPNVKGIIINGGENNIVDGVKIDVDHAIYHTGCPVMSVAHEPSECDNKLSGWPAKEEKIKDVLKSFLFEVCKAEPNWNMKNFVADQIELIRKQVGDKKVLLALSGGVDSSVVAAMLIRAIGKQLVCVHVNHGLMRKGESAQVIEVFKNQLDANLIYVDASERFLSKLENISIRRRREKS